MDAAVLTLSELGGPARGAQAGAQAGVAAGARSWGALNGLTLAPLPGALTVLLGPAGAGKSALVAALAGFARVRGRIELDGQDLARVPAWRRGFGVVLARDVLFPHWSLADNVAYPLRLRGVRRRTRSGLVEQALHLVGLEGAGGLMPAQADARQQRGAMLARAGVFAPRILLLDEPFAGLDTEARAALLASLRRIGDLLGATTLLTTQAGTDALAAGDQVAVLRAGRIEQHGAAEEVFDRPRNALVAGLLGETNRLPGVVAEADEDFASVRLACGPLVEVAPEAALRPGHGCIVSVRPERVAVAAARAAEMGVGALDATLIEARFEGGSYRLRVLIGSGAEMVVRRAAAAGMRGLAVGEGCAVAWQPGHAVAFPA